MIELKLEIDDEIKSYEIPESWDDVTVEQFAKLWTIQGKTFQTKIEMAVHTISLILGIDEEVIYMMDVSDFNKIADAINFVEKSMESKELGESIILEGEEYFIKKDFEKLNMGEVISINIILEKAQGNIAAHMSEMLCVFLRKKKGDKLEGFKNEFMDRKKIFDKVKITEVNNLFSFFLTGKNSLETNTKDYSVEN